MSLPANAAPAPRGLRAWLDRTLAGRSQRQIILIALGATVVLAVALFFVVRALLGLTTNYPSNTTLLILTGDVQVQESTQTEYVRARDGMTLRAGDKLHTGPNTYAVITFFDGSTATLDPSTDVAVASLLHGRGGAAAASAIGLQQLGGRVWSAVMPFAAPSSIYQIDTPAAVALVRGTALLTEVKADDGLTRVRVSEGSVTLRAQGQDVELTPGSEIQVEAGKAPPVPAALGGPSERLRFTASAPVWARIVDSVGRTAGFASPGLPINQIPGSVLGVPFGAETSFDVPVDLSGQFQVVLEGARDGEYQLVVQGFSGDAVAFTDGVRGAMRRGQRYVGALSISLQNGKLIGGRLGAFSALSSGEGPGRFVRMQQAVNGVPLTATAVAAKGTPTPFRTRTVSPTATVTSSPTASPAPTTTTPQATATRAPATAVPATATPPRVSPTTAATAAVPTATRPPAATNTVAPPAATNTAAPPAPTATSAPAR